MGRRKKEIDYISLIRESCQNAGTYESYFEPVITQLSQILERRRYAYNEFVIGGCKMMTTYTNKGNAENEVPNPLLKIINELDSLALNYWKELGLTPKSLKSLNDSAVSSVSKPVGIGAFAINLERELNESIG